MISIISLWAIVSTLLLIAFLQSQTNAKLLGSIENLQNRIESLENPLESASPKPKNWVSMP